jgi:hypothetical protein
MHPEVGLVEETKGEGKKYSKIILKYITSIYEQDTGNMLKTVKQYRMEGKGQGSTVEGDALT